MRISKLVLLVSLLLAGFALVGAREPGHALKFDRSRSRDLNWWKPRIEAYSQRHYGEKDFRLTPKCIVLHYTAGASFPWNLVNSTEFAGESPGLASHYVVEGSHIYELLPPTIRSRGAYGINHRGLNLELVARDAADLANRPQTLEAAAQLVVHLMREYQIPESEIYSHQEVALMDTSRVPWVLDLVNPEPYHKIDPGEANMRTILKRVRQLRSAP